MDNPVVDALPESRGALLEHVVGEAFQDRGAIVVVLPEADDV